jgi:hypothetical protein
MERPKITYKDEIINNQPIKADIGDKNVSMDENKNNPVFENLLAEGGENFFHYINWLGLAKDPNLMILSSIHHYYYDFNDLKGVNTIINLKKLNQINHIDTFLSNVFHVLPPKAKFVGCFVDNKIHRGLSLPFYRSFRFLNGLINMMDSKTDRFMTRKDVIKHLESHDFRIVDMTEISNTTFFCAENHKKTT